jgi:sugar phosphate isomerase/epimerase
MRLAFSTLACPDRPLDWAVETAITCGYNGIELRVVDGELLTPQMSRERRRRTRQIITESGLDVCCVDTSFEIANPEASTDEGLAYVDLAAELGGPMIRLFGGAPRGEPWEATAGRTAERAARLAEHGRPLGVSVAVETHDTFSAGETLSAVLARAPGDVGIIWDTLNAILAGESPERTAAAIGDRLMHVHIKDGARSPDVEENRLLGDGTVPVPAIVRILASRGYEGWLSVEWEKLWQPRIEEPDIALPQYADRLREILREIA